MFSEAAVLDIGGTNVKHALFRKEKLLPESLGQFPVDEKGSAEDILSPLGNYIRAGGMKNVCVSLPGPTDYKTGTPLMRHKFTALYGVSLKEKLGAECPGARFAFVHDAAAYLAGVMVLGETKGMRRPCGVMLGTGLGFAMAEENRVFVNETQTPCPPLWNLPFRDGMAEQFASGRAVEAAYLKESGKTLSCRQIAARADEGDQTALHVFALMGEALGEMLELRGRECNLDGVLLGGQVSKAHRHFLSALTRKTSLPVKVTAHPDAAALYGAFAYGQGKIELQTRNIEIIF